MDPRRLFSELRRRHVYNVAVVYGVVAWLLIQVVATIVPPLQLPPSITTAVILLTIVGFPVAIVLAWAFELTPQGIVRAEEGVHHQPLTRSTARKLTAIVVSFAAIAAALVVYQFLRSKQPTSGEAASAGGVAAKSIAVLPFQNLSEEKENAHFADGVQDEILTALANIADLKVISRTSVMQYRGEGGRNLRQIANELGVAHVVEGSVQRAANKVRVTAQLIDARTDMHLWADRYDRDLSDVFAIQSEIAQTIANKLHAKISPQEKARIEQPATQNLAAYELYMRAKSIWNFDAPDPKALFETVLRLLTEAVTRDPEFVRGHVELTGLYALIYRDFDRSPARAEMVRAGAETIARLRPGSGEALQASGIYHYYVARDYQRAGREFREAVRLLPNDAHALLDLGLTERRLGRWEEALAHFRKASELDPQTDDLVNKVSETLVGLRRYKDAHTVLDRRLTTHPHAAPFRFRKAAVALHERGDLQPFREALAIAPPGFDPAGYVTQLRVALALLERDTDAAQRALAGSQVPEFFGDLPGQMVPRALLEVRVAALGDCAAAHPALLAARPAAEARVQARADDAGALMTLALIDSFLGRFDDAIQEGRRALAMSPPERDGYAGPMLAAQFAGVLTRAGAHAEALDLMQRLGRQPGGLHYGDLLLNPEWDALRGSARFAEILSSLTPADQQR